MAKAVIVIQFRIPEELHGRLKDESHEKRTSMNKLLAEILRKRYQKGDVLV